VSGDVLDRKDYAALHDYLRDQFDEPVDCIVYGHTHNAMNEVEAGILFFNPGTATGRGAPPTVGILTIEGDQVTGEIIEL
jgi:predicted phosphodiesterase